MLPGGDRLQVAIFLSDFSAHHQGAERLSDLLNGGQDFVPALDLERDETIFLNRAGVAVFRVAAEHERDTSTEFTLPTEHASSLTRAAAADNMGVFAQYIGELGAVESDIVECFRAGGGVPYSKYKRFHEVMAEDSGQTIVAALFDHVLPLVPGLVEKLERGIDVLDLGCGRGIALAAMARRFPRSRFLGIDFSEEAIAWARSQVEQDCLANLRYEVRDASAIDYENAFDFIATFDAVHDQAHPDRVEPLGKECPRTGVGEEPGRDVGGR